jgi:hypothetical protein
MAGLVQVGIDSVLGDAELAADLLGAEMRLHQPQAFPFPGRQKLDGLFGSWPHIAHDRKVNGHSPA